jgi:hypothetical protein
MNLEQILATVAEAYADEPEIVFLATETGRHIECRKQLADAVSALPARLSPLLHLEIAHWGINDELSRCREIRAAI